MRDLVVVGAGPAGLAAAVYAALRGARRAGARGQRARRAGRNELEDRELPRLPDGHLRAGAGRPRDHAGAEVRRGDRGRREPRHASPASAATKGYAIELADGTVVKARAIVIASGVQYRRLDLPDLRALRRRGRLLRRDERRGAAVRGSTRSSSSAGATPRGRRPCSWRAGRSTSTCSSALRQPGGDACPATSSSGSRRTRTSPFARGPRSSRSRGAIASTASSGGDPTAPSKRAPSPTSSR